MDAKVTHIAGPHSDCRPSHVSVYEDPNTSEVAAEFDTLAQAVSRHPAKNGAEIIRNGYVLAKACRYCWVLTEDGLKALSTRAPG